jgi:acyl-CoA dehydrogenase
MSILYDEVQRTIANEAQRLVQARTDSQVLLNLLESVGAFDVGFWQGAREQGWTGVTAPTDECGLGLGLIECGVISEAIGAAPAGAPFLAGGYGVIRALTTCKDTSTRGAWIARLATGDAIGAVAFAEGGAPLPTAPSVVFRDGALFGEKPAVPGGLHADVALVWASADEGPVLVLADLAHAARTPIATFDNSRCHGDLRFDGAPAVLLESGTRARRAALDLLGYMAVLAAHEQVGGAGRLLMIARDYANTRRAFGQPIGAFQSVKHRIAELYGLVEIARANCIHAAAQEGRPEFLRAAAAARICATEAYDTAARDCVQIHGGIGVTWEAGLHLHTRRARSLAIETGNIFFWEDVLAELLTGVAA